MIVVALVLVDTALIGAHCAVTLAMAFDPQSALAGPEARAGFRLTRDRSYSEYVEYTKTLLIAVAAFLCLRRDRAPVFLSIAAAALLLLADNSLEVHERVGRWTGANTAISPNVGELVAFALLSLAIVSLMVIGIRRSQSKDRLVGLLFAGCLAAVGFFAVGVDLVHGYFRYAWRPLEEALGLLEDGGELLAITLACALMLFAAAGRVHGHGACGRSGE